MTSSPAIVRSACAEYFGRYDAKRRTWSPPNRCDACPIGVPCHAHGGRPARTIEELEESRATFVREALAVLRGRG